MGKHLDLSDVAGGHPVAERELANLRARAERAEVERDAQLKNSLALLDQRDDALRSLLAAEAETERLRDLIDMDVRETMDQHVERVTLRAELAEAHAQIDRLGLGVPYVEPDEEVK